MPKNKKRSDGRIQAKVYLGIENGKKQYKYVYGKTQKEVDDKILEIKLQKKKGIDISAERDTFKDWAEQWLLIKKAEVSYSWYMNLLTYVEAFEPLYDMSIIKIKAINIQELFLLFSQMPTRKTGKPYSKNTLKKLRTTVSSIFQLAIENRVLDYNPVTAIKLPQSAEQIPRRALTEEEQQWIVDTPHRAQRAAMIMMYAGLRRGELIPLTWFDINLDKGTIIINKSVEMIGGKPQLKDTTKTPSGMRTIYIPKILVDFLANQKRDSTLVCPSAKGQMMSDSSWRSLWSSYLKDLNLKYGNFNNCIETQGRVPKNKYVPKSTPMIIPHFTAHWLRHTFITLMYFAGIDILTAKEQAGHSDIKITMGIYTHLDKEFKVNAMDKMNDYINRKNNKSTAEG